MTRELHLKLGMAEPYDIEVREAGPRPRTTPARAANLLSMIFVSLVLSGCAGYGHDVGPQVTRDHIRAIQLGMTGAEVETLLGKPFAETQEEPDHVFLTYSRKPSGSFLPNALGSFA